MFESNLTFFLESAPQCGSNTSLACGIPHTFRPVRRRTLNFKRFVSIANFLRRDNKPFHNCLHVLGMAGCGDRQSFNVRILIKSQARTSKISSRQLKCSTENVFTLCDPKCDKNVTHTQKKMSDGFLP